MPENISIPITYESVMQWYDTFQQAQAATDPLLWEGITLTPAQYAVLRALVDTVTPSWHPFLLHPPLYGIEVRIITDLTESTPYIRQWSGWPGVPCGTTD